MRKKEVDLSLDTPSQEDVNAIYGEVSDGMFSSADTPLVSGSGTPLDFHYVGGFM